MDKETARCKSPVTTWLNGEIGHALANWCDLAVSGFDGDFASRGISWFQATSLLYSYISRNYRMVGNSASYPSIQHSWSIDRLVQI